MSQIMKAYMALFLLLLMAVSAMGIVTAQMQLIQAENMHKTFMRLFKMVAKNMF